MKNVGGANFSGASQPPKTTEETTSVALRKKKTESPSKAEKAKMEQTNETDKKLVASSTLRGIQSSHQSESPLPMKNKFYAISASSHEASGDVQPQSTETYKKLSSSVATQRFQFSQNNLNQTELKSSAAPLVDGMDDFGTDFLSFASPTENEIEPSHHGIKNSSAEPSSSNDVQNISYRSVTSQVHSEMNRIEPGGAIEFKNFFSPEQLKYVFSAKMTKDGGIKFGRSLENEADHEKVNKRLESRELAVFDGKQYFLTHDHPAVKDGKFEGPMYFKDGVSYPHNSDNPPQVNVMNQQQTAQFLAAGAAHVNYLRNLNQEEKRTEEKAVDVSIKQNTIKKEVVKADEKKKQHEREQIREKTNVFQVDKSLDSRNFYEKLTKENKENIRTERKIMDQEYAKERPKQEKIKKDRLSS